MKIPDIKSMISIAQSTAAAKKPAPAVEQRKAGIAAADSVELSAISRQAAEMAAAKAGDTGRTAEVALLKEQYEKGQYQVDSKATAEAMISEGLFDDLISTKQSPQA